MAIVELMETYPKAALGYRTWRIGKDGRVLMAAHMNDVWRPGPEDAHCLVNEKHRPPEPGCRCGIHAYHTLERAQKERPLDDAITGVIAGRGDIACHHHGWRAAEAQIIALLARGGHHPEDVILGAVYQIPVFTDAAAMETYARQYALPVPASLRPPTPPWWRNTEVSSRQLKWSLWFFVLYIAFMIAMLIIETIGISDRLDGYLKIGIGFPLMIGSFFLFSLSVSTGFFESVYRLRIRREHQNGDHIVKGKRDA